MELLLCVKELRQEGAVGFQHFLQQRLRLVHDGDREADVDDDVIIHLGVVDQRNRDGLADATEVDDGLLAGQQLDESGGNG